MTWTGRISLESHPWLADHAVWGRVLVPGTAFVELALRAGGEIEELTLQAPLAVPERGGVHLQLVAGAEDEAGRRTVGVHSRPEDAPPGTPWTCHATGVVRAGTGPDDFADDLTAWPPPGAVPVDVDGRYDELAGQGYDYGPSFQGLRAAWRRGEEVYAEVSLPGEQDAAAYAVHPALLDAALHAVGLGSFARTPGAGRSCSPSPGPACAGTGRARRRCACCCGPPGTAASGSWPPTTGDARCSRRTRSRSGPSPNGSSASPPPVCSRSPGRRSPARRPRPPRT
ncbi:polyketide synthase dehydratase domain-containing protein [Thermocatellispora tengchongensis]|uniref:polyketide synthase dehydratase domain-containing protein n=1 Tax=Thermocatellispora tengchongensis TaxID=1073253 RepID=UPI003645E959